MRGFLYEDGICALFFWRMRYGLSLEIRGQLGTAAWHFHPGALCLVLVALEEARREKSGSNPVWPDLCLLPALHGLRCREDDGLAGICLPAAGAGVGRCHHHARRRRLQRHAGCRRHGDALRKPCEPPLDGRAPAASARRADPAVGRPRSTRTRARRRRSPSACS